jgi:hypothetical protein
MKINGDQIFMNIGDEEQNKLIPIWKNHYKLISSSIVK